MNIASFIVASFKRSHGPWASALSVPLGYFSWVLKPQDSLPVWLALPITTILVFSICVLVGALQDVIAAKLKAPSIIYASKVDPLSSGNRGIMLLIGESEQLGINTMITVYRTQGESGLEIQLGVGYVDTINSKGHIQAIVYEEPMVPGDDTWERLGNNDAEILRQLIAKPTMPRLEFELHEFEA